MRIFIDDERFPLEHETGQWAIVREPIEAIDMIRANAQSITHISFDNDLGHDLEGRDVLNAIIGTPVSEGIEMPALIELRVHSANIAAAKSMIDLATSGRQHGALPSDLHIVSRSALQENYPMVEQKINEAINKTSSGLLSSAANINAPSQKPDTSGKVELGNATTEYEKMKDGNQR